MKVYVELKSGKRFESSLWLENLEQSLLQLMGVANSFYQVPVSDIVAVRYNPTRHNFQPYEIDGFKSEVDPALVRDSIAQYQSIAAD